MRRRARRRGAWIEPVGLFGAIVLAMAVSAFALVPTFKARVSTDRPLRIVAGLVPPHMTGAGTGREADIIKAALAAGLGTEPDDIEFFVMPFARHWSGYAADNRFDAVATVPDAVEIAGGYRSGHYIAYQNGIGYRCARFPDGIGEDYIADLDGMRVVTFAGAPQIIPSLGRNRQRFATLIERSNQREHSRLLIGDRVDAVIADRAILSHYTREELADQGGSLADFGFTPLFQPDPYAMVYRRKEHQEAFDTGVANLRASGRLEEIEARYRDGTLGDCGHE